MLCRLFFFASLCLLMSACQQQQTTCITALSDLPLKNTKAPSFDWKNTPLRANAQYILYEANSQKERVDLLGDYYFVRWYDAEPQKNVRLVMRYTQAKTGPQVQEKVIEYRTPRESAGEHKERFIFNGAQRAELGDILSWRVELQCDGKVVDSRQSYLWK